MNVYAHYFNYMIGGCIALNMYECTEGVWEPEFTQKSGMASKTGLISG